MPATTLHIKENDKEHKLMFITNQHDNVLAINIYACNEEFIPQGKPVATELEIDEAEYHTNLRKESSKKNQFVANHSTDPQWNPDYIPNIDENFTC